MTKQEIRELSRQRRDAIAKSYRREAGMALAERFAGAREFRGARNFCCFLSLPQEISTYYLLRHIFAAGGAVSIPTWNRETRLYELCAYTPETPMLIGQKGIREPVVRELVAPATVDCFLVPGLAFDHRGGRIGYGKGYYDRILCQAAPDATLCAVCYDLQVLDEAVPLEPHDVRMHLLLTERRLIDCRLP